MHAETAVLLGSEVSEEIIAFAFNPHLNCSSFSALSDQEDEPVVKSSWRNHNNLHLPGKSQASAVSEKPQTDIDQAVAEALQKEYDSRGNASESQAENNEKDMAAIIGILQEQIHTLQAELRRSSAKSLCSVCLEEIVTAGFLHDDRYTIGQTRPNAAQSQ